MKKFMICAMVMGMSFGTFASADEPVTKEVAIAVNDVYVPEFVDHNMDAKIVLTGILQNSCYRWSKAQVTDRDPMTHDIKAMGLVTVNTMCLMVMIPYSKEVNLGKLPVGEHTLRVISADDTFFERKLIVQ